LLNSRQLLLARIQDEEDKQKTTAYYIPTGLNILFPRLSTIAMGTFFTLPPTPLAPGSLGKATARYTPGSKYMAVTSTLTSLTAVHETIHAENERSGIHTGSSQAAKRADEALAYGVELLLLEAKFLKKIDQRKPTDTAATVIADWNTAWGFAGGMPQISAGKAGGGFQYAVTGQIAGYNYYYFTDADFWDIGDLTPPKYGIHFSAGVLRPVYENLIAAKGITAPGGGRVFLPATAIPAGNYFA
jgi:hypothetical protein